MLATLHTELEPGAVEATIRAKCEVERPNRSIERSGNHKPFLLSATGPSQLQLIELGAMHSFVAVLDVTAIPAPVGSLVTFYAHPAAFIWRVTAAALAITMFYALLGGAGVTLLACWTWFAVLFAGGMVAFARSARRSVTKLGAVISSVDRAN